MLLFPYPQNLIKNRFNRFQKNAPSFVLKILFRFFNIYTLIFRLNYLNHQTIKLENHSNEDLYIVLLTTNIGLYLNPKKMICSLKGWGEKESLISNENHFGIEMILSFCYDFEMDQKSRIFNSIKKKIFKWFSVFPRFKEALNSLKLLSISAVFFQNFKKRFWDKILLQNFITNNSNVFEKKKREKRNFTFLKKENVLKVEFFFCIGKNYTRFFNKLPLKKQIFLIGWYLNHKPFFLLNNKFPFLLKNTQKKIKQQSLEFVIQEIVSETHLNKNWEVFKKVLKLKGFFIFKTPYEGNSIENFFLNLIGSGLISKKRSNLESDFSPLIESHFLENYESTLNFNSKKKGFEKIYSLWINSIIFCHENFSKFFFILSRNFFFSSEQQFLIFSFFSKNKFLLISKNSGQKKIKQSIYIRKKIYKFPSNSLIKNLLQFSSSGKAQNYSSLGKF